MALTTIDEIKAAAHLTDEYTDDEILTEIDIVTAELYNDYSLPKRSQFAIDDDYTKFYIYPDKVHEIIRVQVAVETSVDPTGYTLISSSGSTWSHTPPNNYITLESSFMSTYDTKIVRVQFIPKILNLIGTLQVALNLIETTSIVDGQNVFSPQASQLLAKLKRYKSILKPRGFIRSSQYTDFDKYEYVSYTQSDLR